MFGGNCRRTPPGHFPRARGLGLIRTNHECTRMNTNGNKTVGESAMIERRTPDGLFCGYLSRGKYPWLEDIVDWPAGRFRLPWPPRQPIQADCAAIRSDENGKATRTAQTAQSRPVIQDGCLRRLVAATTCEPDRTNLPECILLHPLFMASCASLWPPFTPPVGPLKFTRQ